MTYASIGAPTGPLYEPPVLPQPPVVTAAGVDGTGWRLLWAALMLLIPMALWSYKYFIVNRAMTPTQVVRLLLTLAIESTSTVSPKDQARYRRHFAESVMPTISRKETHSHPAAAQARDQASLYANAYAASVGLLPYVEQYSASEHTQGAVGYRIFYWIKDLYSKPGFARRPHFSQMLRFFGDTDHYIDMPDTLAAIPAVTLISTLTPEEAANPGVHDGYAFCFLDDGTVQVKVAGAATYNHKLWHFGSDCIMTVHRVFGVPVRSTAYLVEKRTVVRNKSLILLVPVGSWGMLGSWLVSFLSCQTLGHLEVVKDGFVRMSVMHSESHPTPGLHVSTGITGQFDCVTVSASTDSAVENITTLSTTTVTPWAVQSHLNPDHYPDEAERKRKAAILALYHIHANKTGKSPRPKITVYPVADSVYRIQPGTTHDPSAKPSVVPFMSPVYLGAYAPDNCKASENAAVLGRVVLPSNASADSTVYDAYTHRDIMDFIRLVAPDTHILSPVTIDYVEQKQDRPAQRKKIADARGNGLYVSHAVKANLKKEPYQTIGDPRVISVLDTDTKVLWSQYTYALADYLKETAPWFAPGKTPVEIAERVADLCSGASSVTETDFSRFDGHVSGVVRMMELALMLRLFVQDCHNDIDKLHKRNYGCASTTTHGIKYTTGFTRLSGSPETSVANTLANPFVAYCAIRNADRTLTAEQAYSKLGIYGGDDGATTDITAKAYVGTARRLGFKIEAVEHLRPASNATPEPVKFLARLYPDAWAGRTDSVCDLRRVLSKIHVTVDLAGVSALEKLRQKMIGYTLSDKHTPFIGPWAAIVVQKSFSQGTGPLDDDKHKIRPYNTRVSLGEQYPNDGVTSWAVEYFTRTMPDFNFHLLNQYLATLEASDSYDEKFLSPPLIVEPTKLVAKHDAVVNGSELVKGTEPPRVEPPKGSAHIIPDQFVVEGARPMSVRPAAIQRAKPKNLTNKNNQHPHAQAPKAAAGVPPKSGPASKPFNKKGPAKLE